MNGRKTAARFSPEVRVRAVRLVLEHQGEHASQWASMVSVAAKIGWRAQTLRKWLRQVEHDRGLRFGPTMAEQDRIGADLPRAADRPSSDHAQVAQ